MNGIMPHTVTATELQRNYKRVAKKARELSEPLVVLSNSQPEGVYIDFDTYKQSHKFSKKKKLKKTTKKSGLDDLYGSWTKEEAGEFNKTIDKMFEKIDPEMWK